VLYKIYKHVSGTTCIWYETKMFRIQGESGVEGVKANKIQGKVINISRDSKVAVQ
jgi:hypothetical protein